ncbi:MAG: hypothetical protein K6A43_06185 [Treponema sp.]|nr:hypothetical protein [Treponema sp.]
MEDSKKRVIIIFSFLYMVALIFALKVHDVGMIGPEFTTIGLSKLNNWFRHLWHYNEELGYFKFWYIFVQVLGYFSLVPCVFWTVLFVRELINAKSLDGVGVDKNLMATFFLYIITVLFCCFYKLIPVNYGPIILPGKTKISASFPSFHVVIIIISWASTIFLVSDLLGQKKKLVLFLHILFTAIMAIGIFGCMICGIYWVTDILGGLLFCITLIPLYSFFFDI